MENPARYYVIHKYCLSYLTIPLKGNPILKYNTLIIDISCSLKSEIWTICRKHCTGSFHGLKMNTLKAVFFMRMWYLSHRRPAKAQTNLRIRAVSPEPSQFAHIKYGSRRRVRPKFRWMAAHERLKNEFTEDEKYHGSYNPTGFYF